MMSRKSWTRSFGGEGPTGSGPIPRPQHRFFAALYNRIVKMDDKQLRPLREFAAGGAAGRVLEIGCGTGSNFSYYCWSQVESLDATEPDPFMRRRAEAALRKLDPAARAKVTLHEALAEELPFPDATFDAVVSTLVLCSVFNLDRTLDELRRVLRPDGELRLVEHVSAEGVAARAQRLVQPLYGWLSGGCHLSRQIEALVQDHQFDLKVTKRFSLGGPLWPAFVGIGRRTRESP